MLHPYFPIMATCLQCHFPLSPRWRLWRSLIVPFSVGCNTLDCFFFSLTFQSYIFDAASLFQTNHVVHQNAPREDIFSVWRHDFFVLRDVHSQRVYLQEESLSCGMRLKKNRAEFVLTIF